MPRVHDSIHDLSCVVQTHMGCQPLDIERYLFTFGGSKGASGKTLCVGLLSSSKCLKTVEAST